MSFSSVRECESLKRSFSGRPAAVLGRPHGWFGSERTELLHLVCHGAAVLWDGQSNCACQHGAAGDARHRAPALRPGTCGPRGLTAAASFRAVHMAAAAAYSHPGGYRGDSRPWQERPCPEEDFRCAEDGKYYLRHDIYHTGVRGVCQDLARAQSRNRGMCATADGALY